MDRIRSYVTRATRMSAHQKSAYDRLQNQFCIPFAENIPDHGVRQATFLQWKRVFPHRVDDPDRPIILDIGFGMGYELADLADLARDQDFLGVEVHKPGVGKLLSEIERRSLENVRIIQHDAVPVFRYLIPPATVQGVHLFFPDPWPKKRHHKRRLVRPGFPELIAPLLQSGGYLYLVTDWEDYALQMLRVLEDFPGLVNRFRANDGFAPPQDWRPQTAFERKGLRKGHRIFELIYDRKT